MICLHSYYRGSCREISATDNGACEGIGSAATRSADWPIMEAYRTSPRHDKRSGFRATQRDKPPHKIHHGPVIRADLELLADLPPDPEDRVHAPPATPARAKTSPAKTPEKQAPPPPAPIPAWARAGGRAGEGESLFAAGAGLALLDAALRADPPAAGALRARLALQSAAACEKSCASTPTKPRCATSASPSATRAGPRQTCCEEVKANSAIILSLISASGTAAIA